MEQQLYQAIVALLAALDHKPRSTRFTYSDRRIVEVYYWAVIHDRPISWACRRANWPLHLRRQPLPSDSRMSRRLRSPAVVALLAALERRVIAPKQPGLFWVIDGKPLVIGGCSKDRQAGYGRAAAGKAKGYKLHALVGAGGIAAWRIAPMHKDERVMAARLLRWASIQGYLVADSNYDSNPLHALCDRLGELQLIARRRYGSGHGLGHHRHSPGRLRSIARTENPFPAFADRLLQDRSSVERAFGNLVNWGGGLACLPAWVRTHRRVHRWVQAKLVLAALKRSAEITTCAA
jgi:Transposase DDE domain